MNKLILLLCALAVTGCATKNYGRQGNLTDYERSTMTCREIELESAKVHGFLDHVDKESEFDGRSVLSFLGDFGIGNLMEKSSAQESATARLAQLQEARTKRNCDSTAAAEQSVVITSNQPVFNTQKPRKTGRDSYTVEHMPETRACNPYPTAELAGQEPGIETYSVACTNGNVLAVRCELTGCRVLK